MTDLRKALVDYLVLRRSLGYKLVTDEHLLGQFLDFLEAADAEVITTVLAISWATLPSDVNPGWRGQRLSAVRCFASFVASIDEATEVPPAGCLPGRPTRATPYIYSDAEVEAIMTAARSLSNPLLAHTYEALIGLLAVTGLRIGEAICLSRDDILLDEACVRVIEGKLGKSREVPLARSSVDASPRSATSFVQRRATTASFARRRGRGSPTRGCGRPSPNSASEPASSRRRRASGQGCTICATVSRLQPSSPGKRPAPTSARSCRCCRR
jgi:integrase/recombinase XerD